MDSNKSSKYLFQVISQSEVVLDRGFLIRDILSWSELSTIGTSPDFVQNLEFF